MCESWWCARVIRTLINTQRGGVSLSSSLARGNKSWARYQFCRIYFKICRRGTPAKILKKFAVGPDFHQDLSNLRCGVGLELGGWGYRLGLLGLEG